MGISQYPGGTGGGVSDHGNLTGLGDDDHSIYSLADGSRAFTNPVGGVDGVASTDLATKGQVDNATTVAQIATAQSVVDDETSSTSHVDSSLAATITPKHPNSLLIVKVDGEFEVRLTGSSFHPRYGFVAIRNETDAVQIADEARGRNLAASSAEAAPSWFPISLVGHYTVNSTTARTFRFRFRSASAQTTAKVVGTRVGGVRMTIEEVRL